MPILQKALESVIRQVIINAGEIPEVIMAKLNPKKPNFGWNAKDGKYGDLIKLGILDATLVVEQVIKNAVGAASYFLTMESTIVETVEEENIPVKHNDKRV